MLALLVRAAATLILIVLCVCVKKRARENETLEITEVGGGEQHSTRIAPSVLLTRNVSPCPENL